MYAFIPKYHCLPLGGLVHFGITLAFLVLGRTVGRDDRGIHDRAIADLDADASQMLVHCIRQRLAEPVTLQQMAKFAHRPLTRCGFLAQIDSRKVAHRRRVMQDFFNCCFICISCRCVMMQQVSSVNQSLL